MIENLTLSDKDQTNCNPCSIIGYGTFITRGVWENKVNVEVCVVQNYTRIYPKGYWFPFVLPSKESFWALKFEVDPLQLEILDNYEGLSSGFFKRVVADIVLKDNSKSKAFIYVPTKKTIEEQNLSSGYPDDEKGRIHIK